MVVVFTICSTRDPCFNEYDCSNKPSNSPRSGHISGVGEIGGKETEIGGKEAAPAIKDGPRTKVFTIKAAVFALPPTSFA